MIHAKSELYRLKSISQSCGKVSEMIQVKSKPGKKWLNLYQKFYSRWNYGQQQLRISTHNK